MKSLVSSVFKRTFSLAALLMIGLLVTSCNIPRGQAASTPIPQLVFPTFPPSATPELQTATAQGPEATSAVSPTELPPTAIKAPTMTPGTIPQQQSGGPAPTAVSNAKRIAFARGSTSEVIEGTMQPGVKQNYVVTAMQGQPLIISVDSADHDIIFAIVGQKDGKTLVDATQKLNTWQTILTASQQFLITLFPSSTAENYTLSVIIPARIAFPQGATSATVQGSTPDGLIVSYVLRASAGQQMDINLTAPGGNAVLGVYGYQDGQPYLRSAVEQTTFSMKLPTTQDYIIQVIPRAGQVANYSMKVTVK